jgi:hypothetical protein
MHRLSIIKSQRNNCIPTKANIPIHRLKTKRTGRTAFAAKPALKKEEVQVLRDSITKIEQHGKVPRGQLLNQSELFQHSKSPHGSEQTQQTKNGTTDKRAQIER